jgi:hypothetical protein
MDGRRRSVGNRIDIEVEVEAIKRTKTEAKRAAVVASTGG